MGTSRRVALWIVAVAVVALSACDQPTPEEWVPYYDCLRTGGYYDSTERGVSQQDVLDECAPLKPAEPDRRSGGLYDRLDEITPGPSGIPQAPP